MNYKLIYILIAVSFFRSSFAQDTTTIVKDSIPKVKVEIPVITVIDDSINDENIQTVLIHKTGWEISVPIINLNTSETLSLSFDEFGEDVKRYKYTILQCDADWNASELTQNQYLDGYYEDNITEYKLSVNTVQSYIHYKLSFPKETMKITKSGNYIICIYNENNPDNTLIIKRFMVMEQKVNINAKIKDATLLNDKKYKQEVDFSIVSNNFYINNPSQHLKVKILQNMRPDNAIGNLKPNLIKGNELEYDYDEGNTFNGCNEFRNFDIKSLKYNSMRINHITYEDRANQVYLHNDPARRFKVYKTEDDINGKRVIKSDNSKDSETEADYTYVHFTLPYDIPTVEGYLHIYGALTNWKLDENSKMTYNHKNRAYEGSVYVKQGYYNYMYVLQRPDKKIDDTFVEGNHAETENDYFIIVYYRQMGEQYDKLIGFRQLNSINDRN